MVGRYHGIDDLPEILGIFPLSGVLLLPRGQLPLNVFEPRYLELVDDALKSNRLIGISSHEITCSGRAVASEMEYAFWRPSVRGPTPMTTKVVTTMMAAAPITAQSKPKLS